MSEEQTTKPAKEMSYEEVRQAMNISHMKSELAMKNAMVVFVVSLTASVLVGTVASVINQRRLTNMPK